MKEEEILKALESILHKPTYDTYNGDSNRKLFYIQKKQGTQIFYTFSNRTVARLIALSKKLHIETEKKLFWEIFNPHKPRILLGLFGKALSTKVQRHVFQHQDFIFMFFAKSHKMDSALDIIDRYITVSSNGNKLLSILLESLICDRIMFERLHLNRILTMVERYRSFIYGWEQYMEVTAGKRMLIPPETVQKDFSSYKNIRANDVNVCRRLLKQIENAIHEIRLAGLDSFLFEGTNLEINQDQEKLKEIINTFGFDSALNESINKIDQKLYVAQDDFDFKGCIDLIRAF